MNVQSYFVWKNMDCRAMGITLASAPPLVRGEEAVQHITIPGRPGDLTMLEGTGIYKSYIQTVNISVKGEQRIREIMAWLSGAGEVTFSSDPSKKQSARVIGAVTLNRISRNMDRWSGEVQFYCQPYKSRLVEDTVTLESHESETSGGSTQLVGSVDLYNDGDIAELPIIRANFVAGSHVRIVSSSGAFVVNMHDYATTGMIIDSQAQEVYTVGHGTLLTDRSTGEFPRIDPGSLTLSAQNFNSLIITRARRYL